MIPLTHFVEETSLWFQKVTLHRPTESTSTAEYKASSLEKINLKKTRDVALICWREYFFLLIEKLKEQNFWIYLTNSKDTTSTITLANSTSISGPLVYILILENSYSIDRNFGNELFRYELINSNTVFELLYYLS